VGKSARKGTLEKVKSPPVKKPAAKTSVVKPAAKKPPVKAVAKVAASAKKTSKPVVKSAVPVPAKNPAPAKPVASAPVVKTAKTLSVVKTAVAALSGTDKTTEVKIAKGAKAAKVAKVAETPAVDPTVKRAAKLFFIEVKPGAERVIKRGDKSLAAPAPVDVQARRKDTATEETSEELVERIERELQHQSFFKRNTLKPQMCTKCGINVVAERFTIDRELGYCLSCADILRLGATKEARRMEFNPSLKKEGEGAAAEGDAEIIAPPIGEPDAAEVEEETIPDID
jgi:hypothetical protein